MPSTRTLLIQYRYDPLDRVVSCTPATLPSHQRFYLKDRLATEIQGAIQRSIFQQEDQLLAQQQHLDGVVETTLLATDQQRSVLHALDAARPHRLVYTPYGHRLPESGMLSLLGFNGERPDPVTGHYLLGNGYRAFNPVLMRFNSPDRLSPFGEGGLNAYAYCVGDPVNRKDPTGHIPLLAKLMGASDFFRPPAKTATVGVATSVTEVKPGFFGAVLETMRQSLVKNPKGPLASMSAPRAHIDEIVIKMQDPPPFVKSLKAVNENLASHGDDSLSMEQAREYGKLAREVNQGEISNTGAHVSSGALWFQKFMQEGTPVSFVGLFFNGVIAPFSSGSLDHSLRVTGKALRRS
ncbi:RHS repeat-associated core domain-containing protein [Pseudomonas citrulli]|uniref:RHS repeat-associated core domain-containing protein n=1 Tax=Pseudomonas citrulli TaxID=3064347 RepID=A0ABT9BV80_9PSED|nr:RHS repeat-associated core domain-containing protein [Pseudomonas sp. K18]MDO7896437.1 RHS repeat-associated core domain-containing protein [Pseudomonas sp. K18]